MDKKYGVYICTGCGIGDALDIDALSAVADEEGLPVQTHPMFCGKEGVEVLKKDIDEKGINTLVICACSRRVNFDIFRFDGCIVDRVNLREQVVWSHPRSEFPALTEDQVDDGIHFDRLKLLAEDYLKMGMARVEKVDLPKPYQVETFSRKILVIGGGITGLSGALDAAKAGFDVTIVEKESELGGHAKTWRKQLPIGMPYEVLSDPMIDQKIQEVQDHPRITVKTETVVARMAGEPGNFTVTLKKPGEKIEFDVPYPLPDEMKVDENGKELNAEQLHEKFMEYNEGKLDILQFDPDGEKFGAVILAAGWQPAKLEGEAFAHLSIDLPDVVTNAEFEKIAKAGKIARPSDGQEAKSVVFIQSPDKEDDGDFAYTGAVTSLVSLKQAKYVREDYPDDGKAYVIYQHMRTVGLTENFYKSIQQDEGIFLTKGTVAGVSPNGDGLIVEADDTLLGEKLQPATTSKPIWTCWLPEWFQRPSMILWSTWLIDRARLSATSAFSTVMLIPITFVFLMKPSGPASMPPVAFAAA